jgi:hypothetical protein
MRTLCAILCLLPVLTTAAFGSAASLTKATSFAWHGGHRTYPTGTRVDATQAANGQVQVTTEDGATASLPIESVVYLPTTTPSPPTPLPAAKPSATSADADTTDLKTLSGKVYKSARVFRVEPDGLTYMFFGGLVKIDFTDLPESIRKKYGYDPARARQFAAQDDALQRRLSATIASQDSQVAEEHATAERARLAKEAIAVNGTVFRKLPQGLVVDCGAGGDSVAVGDSMASVGGGGGVASGVVYAHATGMILLKGHPREAELADDDQIDVQAAPAGTMKIGQATLHEYQFVK